VIPQGVNPLQLTGVIASTMLTFQTNKV